ncbi:MAG TPA: hypothetical protein VG605_15005 [Puia sp.]|nr:hypothetical protein [Puia sp.]
MVLYAPHITPRLRYIVDFCSREQFDEPIRLTSDKEAFLAHPGPRINYSSEAIDKVFSIVPVSLLFETDIRPQPVECFEVNGRKAFFASSGDLPFDIFAATFYLISRYEEYLPHARDEYGRYAHTGSLAWREGFLDIPLVNYWLQDLRDALAHSYPDPGFRYPNFKFIPTYDIDSAFSYRFKEWWRNLGGGLKSLLKGRWAAVGERIRVLRGLQQDPFDAYEWLDSLHLYCRLRPYYFFLVAARCKGVDRNLPPSSPGFRELIQYHGAGYRLGIHPSWRSGDDERLLQEEIEWLEVISGQTINRSRQHYIRFSLPQTYRRLLRHNITRDFSMGYGSINGFRASVASSFSWYDLGKEEATDLRVFPFCFMDANSYYEQKYTPSQAMSELLHYYRHTRKVNGLMITIWHNSFLGADPAFAGWREVYEIFLKEEVFWNP